MSKLYRQIIRKTDLLMDNKTSKDHMEKFVESLHPYSTEKKLIRLGPNGDGGYLVPDDLSNIEACFSPGVDQISEFEENCYEYGMKLFLADKSVDAPNWNMDPNSFNFIKRFIGCTTNEDFITMDDWVNSSNVSVDSDLLLQMDIEGGEYLAIINMSNSLLNRFRIMVFEFHYFERLWNIEYFNLVSTAFKKILQNHTCVHIHPNNCCGNETMNGIELPRVSEFTFIRNDRVKDLKFQTTFPHELDFDCTEEKPLNLPKNWYRS